MAALAVMAGVIVLASGCGGGSSTDPDASPSATSNVAKEVAYTNCMRAHGVAVSVGSNGGFSVSGSSSDGSSGASQKAFDSAQDACRHLLPNGGQPNQAQRAAHQAQALQQALKYTQCMRSHGVPDFPDPKASGTINISTSGHRGSNVSGPLARASAACAYLLLDGSATASPTISSVLIRPDAAREELRAGHPCHHSALAIRIGSAAGSVSLMVGV